MIQLKIAELVINNNHSLNVIISHHMIFFLLQSVTGNDGSENVSSPFNLLQITLAAFSTSYNVIFYVIFNASFRNAFKQLLMCWKKTKIGVSSAVPHTFVPSYASPQQYNGSTGVYRRSSFICNHTKKIPTPI